jgi:hypothetical protein
MRANQRSLFTHDCFSEKPSNRAVRRPNIQYEWSSLHNAIGEDCTAKKTLAGNCTVDSRLRRSFRGACAGGSAWTGGIDDVGVAGGILTGTRQTPSATV